MTSPSLPLTSDAGFTLLELLVALSVLALLSVLLFGSLRFGVRVWERSEGALASADHVRQVETSFRHDLTRAYPLVVSTDPDHAHIAFDGRADRMTFLAPDGTLSGALDYVTIASEAGAKGLSVTRSASLELAAQVSPRKEVLFQPVKQVRFSYLGADGADELPTWHSEWRGKMRLPTLVRIEITFPDRPPDFWPALVVAPRLASDVGCVFDPLTKKCRGR